MLEDVEASDFVIFIGALDGLDRDFRVFKVPSSFLLANLGHIDMNADGWINLHINTESFVDLRHPSGLSFAAFAVN